MSNNTDKTIAGLAAWLRALPKEMNSKYRKGEALAVDCEAAASVVDALMFRFEAPDVVFTPSIEIEIGSPTTIRFSEELVVGFWKTWDSRRFPVGTRLGDAFYRYFHMKSFADQAQLRAALNADDDSVRAWIAAHTAKE